MPRLLEDWVRDRASSRLESVAIVGDTRLTYGELDTLSTQLARVLKEAGARQGDRVGLLMPKSPLAIAGLLGIYKADCIYVPLDPSSPVSRLQKIFDSCENKWLLAAGPVAPTLEQLVQDKRRQQFVHVGWLDTTPPPGDSFRLEFTLDDVLRCSSAPVASQNGSDAPAHILFTSGSTGIPKGVVITHFGVIRFIEWAIRYFGIDSSDRVSGHPPLYFDVSLLDIFGAAAAGGQVHLVPRELNLLPHKLAGFIRASELTQWFSVPSVLNYMASFDAVRFNDFPRLRRLIWAGEVLPTLTLIHWMKRLPHVKFTNLYGPTETTIASSYYTVPACPEDPRAAIPLGAACEGEELLVLDESLQPLGPGATGELYIGGVGLARGYWRDPEKTAAAFVQHPARPLERIYKTGDLARIGEDGLVYFLGRSDSQIKSRGYRIELGEVEAALHAIPGLQECAVVAANTGSFEGAVICCAYVPANGRELTPAGIRRELSRLVPGYMLPARWLAFDRLPQNASGKIDRRRLKEAFEGRLDARAAQTA